jgi:hypothetical protein
MLMLKLALFKNGHKATCSVIPKLINSIAQKEELPQQCKESNAVPIYK